MSYYDRLLRETAIEREEFRVMPMVQTIIADGMSRQDYLGFLEQPYHIVWHFVPTITLTLQIKQEKSKRSFH